MSEFNGHGDMLALVHLPVVLDQRWPGCQACNYGAHHGRSGGVSSGVDLTLAGFDLLIGETSCDKEMERLPVLVGRGSW